MAPEQKAGKSVDARSDRYAFCVMLQEALFAAAGPVGAKRVAEAAAMLERLR
jgi:hypothetical protein